MEQKSPFRPLPLHRLSLKMAMAVAGAVVGLLLVVRLIGLIFLFWQILLFAAAVGAVVYAVAVRMLAARLELARSTLRQIRKRQFENLEAAKLPRGDELNALVWQVYRTGLTLEKEIAELKRLENYRREFLGNVSHELKTPIFAVRGFTETLLGGALDDERVRAKFVEKIQRNAERLGHLAEDLSEVARIEMGELEMTMAPFRLGVLVHEVVESLEPAAEAMQVSLRAHIPDNLPPVLGDRERIRQVLVNLADNAIKYNNQGGQVEIVARRLPSKQVKISVVDDGIGIAPQYIDRLTERFYRVDTSRSRSQGGTGLGLAIVKHILGAHDSRLLIESQPDRGSTFGFSLPTTEDAVEEELA
ncbi:MAG TPA: ATP-binding protein [Rhodothermales bacterium]|nr:ATP-binding protein [Rhodothermales bacterium]